MPEQRTGRRLILNDGTTIEDGQAGCFEGVLWAYLTGYTLQQASSLFFDTEKTEKIIFQYGEMEDEYNGYTNCFNININVDGRVSVGLRKAGD